MPFKVLQGELVMKEPGQDDSAWPTKFVNLDKDQIVSDEEIDPQIVSDLEAGDEVTLAQFERVGDNSPKKSAPAKDKGSE